MTNYTYGAPGDWNATGASTPTFTNNCEYQIFVQATDNAGLKTNIGSLGSSNRIRIKISAALPDSQVVLPPSTLGSNNNYWRTSGDNALTKITGTASEATGGYVRVQVIVSTGDAIFPEETSDSKDNLCWGGPGSGNAWLECDDDGNTGDSGFLFCRDGESCGSGVVASTFVVVPVNSCGGQADTWCWGDPFPAGFPGSYTDHPFRVRTRAYLGSVDEPLTEPGLRNFHFDMTAPGRAMIIPSASSSAYKAGALAVLSGTAQDPNPPVTGDTPSGMDNDTFKFRIVMASATSTAWCPSLLNYADASVCSDEDILGNKGAGVNYSTGAPYLSWTSTGPWREGYRYKVILGPDDNKLKDKAQNGASQLDNTTFRYDTVKPTATLSLPILNVGTISVLGTISGTVYDWDPDEINDGVNYLNASGIDSVQTSSGVGIAIMRLSDGKYFDQTKPEDNYWPDQNQKWWPANVGNFDWDNLNPDESTWSYTQADLNTELASGEKYVIVARAKDKAANQQSTWQTADASSMTIVIDKEAPTLDITAPTTVYNFIASHANRISAIDIAGTAADGPAATKAGFAGAAGDVRIMLWRILGDGTSQYWNMGNGGEWVVWQASFSEVVSGQTSWGFNFLDPSCDSAQSACIDWGSQDYRYYVTARVRDNARNGLNNSSPNSSVYLDTTSFIVDVTNPVSTFTVPGTGVQYVNTLANMAGTVDASSSGITGGGKVELRIVQTDNSNEWTGSSWTVTANTWFSATANDTNWNYSLPLSSMTDNKDYQVTIKATDRAGNAQSPVITRTFEYDASTPTVAMTNPSETDGAAAPYSNAVYNSEASRSIISTITASYSDSGANANALAEAYIAISSGSGADTLWWSNAASSFTVNQTDIFWNQATTLYTSSFVYAYSSLGSIWRDGRLYKVFAKARDTASNWRGAITSPPADCEVSGDYACQEFRYDISRPASDITRPIASYENASVTVASGTVTNAGPATQSVLSKVRLAIKCVAGDCGPNGNPGNYWNWYTSSYTVTSLAGSAWGDAAIAGGVEWSTPVIVSSMFITGSTYTIVARVSDQATNEEQDGDAQGNTFLYDAVAPTTTITMPAADGRYRQLPNITGTLSETLSTMQEVRLAIKEGDTSNFWSGAAFAAFDSVTSWRPATVNSSSWSFATPESSLTTGVTYYIALRGRDGAGNWNRGTSMPSQAESTAFLWDKDKPISKTTVPASNTAFNYIYNSILGTAYDCPNSPQGECANPGVAAGIRSQTNQGVRLRICRDAGVCINDTTGGWTETEASFNLEPTLSNNNQNWSWSKFSGQFGEGYRYRVVSRALDETLDSSLAYTNYETSLTTNAYVIDLTTPTHAISSPTVAWSGMDYYQTISTFSGTADDRIGLASPQNYEAGLGTAASQRSIWTALQVRKDEYKWWDVAADTFSVTQSSPHWQYGVLVSTANDGTSLVGSSSGTWNFYINKNRLQNETSYYLNVRAQDLAGNLEIAWSTRAFIVDTSTPSTTLTNPTGAQDCPASGPTSLSFISGTAQDVGIGEMSVVLLRIIRERTDTTNGGNCDDGSADDGKCWDGTSWVTCANNDTDWISSGTVNGSWPDWAYSIVSGFLQAKTVYKVWVRAKDKAGNVDGQTLPTNPTTDPVSLRFRFAGDPPNTVITTPNVSAKSRYKMTDITQIAGTSYNSLNVRVRITRMTDSFDYRQYTSSGEYLGSAYWFAPVSTSGAQGNWNSIALTTHAWDLANASYTIKSRGCSAADEGEPSGDAPCASQTGNLGSIVWIDTHSPTAVSTVPVDGAVVKDLTYIGGTVAEPAANSLGKLTVNAAKFRIRREETPFQYYDPAQAGKWADNPPGDELDAYMPVGADGSQAVNWSSANIVGWAMGTGYKYTIFTYARDEAGNPVTLTDSQQSVVVTFDTSPPVAVTTQPAPGYVYKEMIQLAGTASDESALASPRDNEAGLAVPNANQIRIERISDNNTFTGDAFSSAQSWVAASGTNPWTYSDPDLNTQLRNFNGAYAITSRSSDTIGNLQTSYPLNQSTFTFYMDKSSPTATITKPVHFPGAGSANGKYRTASADSSTTLPYLSGTASDDEASYYGYGSGDVFQTTQIRLWYLAGNTSYYYDGAGTEGMGNFATYFDTNENNWIGADAADASTTPWRRIDMYKVWQSTSSDIVFYLQTRSRDRARDTFGNPTGNVQDNFGALGDSGNSYKRFVIDGTLPTIVIDTPSGSGFSNGLNFRIDGRVNGDLAELKVPASSGVVVRLFCESGVDKYFWDWNSSWVLNASTHVRVPTYTYGFAVGTNTWSLTANVPSQANFGSSTVSGCNNIFKVGAEAVDLLDQLGAATTIQFTMDTQGPMVSITNTANRARVLNNLAGTSSDSPAGLAKVEMRIRRLGSASPTCGEGANKWWNKAGAFDVTDNDANAAVAFFDVAPPWTGWTASSASANVASGCQYEYSIKGLDTAGNYSTTYATYTTVFDDTSPQTQSTYPAAGQVPVRTLTYIRGTFAEKTGSGDNNTGTLSVMRAILQRLDTNPVQYWDSESVVWGNYYMMTSTANQVGFSTSLNTWSITGVLPSGSKLPIGTTYYLTTSGIDNTDQAGNAEPFGVVSSTFVYESSAPVSFIDSPANGAFLSALTSLTGTMADEPTYSQPSKVSGGIDKVEVQISTGSNDCYNGSGWTICPYWLSASTTAIQGPTTWISSGTWIKNTGLPTWLHNRTYWILVRSSDNAGSVEDTSAATQASSRSVTFDLDAPTATVAN
ncbi:MAG: hypothetical protein HY747_11175, partial [Elusimicrobia bacterium]|nr:hypothetical protein [Elusimicrobiota bacterium]